MFHMHKKLISLILFTNVFTSMLLSIFSFTKIIHQPDSCVISRSLLNSMIFTQVNLVLGTIKGHSKMCNATSVSENTFQMNAFS